MSWAERKCWKLLEKHPRLSVSTSLRYCTAPAKISLEDQFGCWWHFSHFRWCFLLLLDCTSFRFIFTGIWLVGEKHGDWKDYQGSVGIGMGRWWSPFQSLTHGGATARVQSYGSFGLDTFPETNIKPETRLLPKGNSSSKLCFSVAMFVLGRVICLFEGAPLCSFFHPIFPHIFEVRSWRESHHGSDGTGSLCSRRQTVRCAWRCVSEEVGKDKKFLRILTPHHFMFWCTCLVEFSGWHEVENEGNKQILVWGQFSRSCFFNLKKLAGP